MMKKISIFLLAAAVLLGGGCEDSSDTDKVIPVSAIALDSSLSGGITMEVGQTTNIAGKVTILPEDATNTTESYESSNAEIVAVDGSGAVKALKPGLAMITISVGGKHTHFEVKVEAKKVPVESVTLPAELADGVTLKIGETLDIAGKAIITPENATERTESYSSSVPMIASVSEEGVVTAVEIGKTTISVSVDGVQASFELTVAEDVPVALEKIEIKNGATAIQGSASVVLGENTTFDLYAQLQLSPANQTEGVKYIAYGPEEIATIDENGIVTCKGVGTVTFVILAKSNPANPGNDFKNAGAKKAYFAVNITAPHDLDRTGWEVSANSGAISGTAGSKTAAFDNVFDPGVFKDVKGSNFGLTKPTTADGEVWFVVDMQKEQTVNYFRLMHQSCRNTDRSCRWKKFSAILGSNDGETFTQIASDVEVPNLDNAPGIDPNDGGSRNIDKYHTCSNVKLPNTVKYRYLKFVGKKDCFTGTAKTCQFSEMYLGLDE